MGINSNEAVADLNEEVTKNDLPGVPEGFANLSQVQKQDYLNGSIGTGLNTPVQPIFQYVNVPYNLRYKLRAAKIGVEVVDALINLAVYDSNEKILKIRKDADLEHVENYIESVILPDLEVKLDEKSGEITPPTPLNLSGEPEVEQEPQTEPQLTPEPIIEPTIGLSEPFDADKVGSLTEEFEKSKTEDVADILNQPQVQMAPETKPEEQNPGPTAESQSTDGSNPEWLKEKQPGEVAEWEELERLRFHLTRAENQKATTIGEMTNLGMLRDEYEAKKQKLANVLREKLTGVSEGPLTKDQQKFVNDTLFEELVQKESESYLNALKENRSETWKDKGKEALRTVAGLKAVGWYLKQNKWVRLGVTTSIATAVGMSLGGIAAGGAVAYGGFRMARGAASFTAAGLVNKYLQESKLLSIDDVENLRNKKIEEIKQSDKSLEEKTKELQEINAHYERTARRRAIAKNALTIGAGASAGLLAGFAEYLTSGPTAVAAVNDPEQANSGGGMDKVIEGQKQTEVVKPEAKPGVSETSKVFEVPEVPKMSFKPQDLVHEVKAGDSTWNILKEVLKHDERFKNLSGTGTPQEIAEQIEAKQTRVLHDVLAKSLKNHDQYNIGPNGEIKVGDTVNFSKLFVNAQEYDEIIKDAENLKPTQISSIIESNRKIETWLKENSGKKFDLDEIMSTKPKLFVMPKPEMVEPKLPDAPELEKPKVPLAEDVEVLKPISPDLPETTLQDQAGLTEEVVAAKKRLGILEEGRERLRTMSSDTLEVAQNAEIREAVEGVLRNEVDDIYGEHGWFKKVAGIDTKEWKTIAGLPARRVLEYFKSPETSDLPKTILAELQTSEKHRKLVERIAELVEGTRKHSNADFKPYDNGENVGDYIKRIGGFLMRQQKEPGILKRAA